MSKEKSPLRAVKGMNDILPGDSQRWEWLEDAVRSVMRTYGYQSIRTPIVEPTPLFVRGLGEVTDIVEKEMYSFVDHMNGDQLTLRPENTAGVVRAVIEHNLLYDGPKRMYYVGPMFRHERPQRGRYRQFHQVGVEALGMAGPEVDAEVILMARALWRKLGLSDIRLEINSLGQLDERQSHRQALIAYFEQHQDQLDDDAKRRLHSNPLRILDTKNPAMKALVEAAPRLMDFLGEQSLGHFKGVCDALDAAGQAYVVNPRLVRGMDYYNLTVFEWVTDRLGAQGTVCGGGRYDPLIEMLGGKPAPGIGWGMGMERVLELTKEAGLGPQAQTPDVYVVVSKANYYPQSVALAEVLRQADLSVQLHPRGTDGVASMKSQFKKADASGARWAVILGEAEMAMGEVSVKALRADAGAVGAQTSRRLLEASHWAADLRHA